MLETYGMTHEESMPVVNALRQRPDDWVDFMMRFELGLERPDPKRAVNSAATIAASYIAGGFIPLSPYTLMTNRAHAAFFVSVAVTLIAVTGTNNPTQRTVKPNPKSATPTLSSTLASLSPQERQTPEEVASICFNGTTRNR